MKEKLFFTIITAKIGSSSSSNGTLLETLHDKGQRMTNDKGWYLHNILRYIYRYILHNTILHYNPVTGSGSGSGSGSSSGAIHNGPGGLWVVNNPLSPENNPIVTSI